MDGERTLALDLLTLGESLRRMFDVVREREELGAIPFFLLATLAVRGRMKMAQLSSRLELTKGNLTYHVDRLEAMGLVARDASATDRRVIYLDLTVDGRARYDRLVSALQAAVEIRLAALKPEEMVVARSGLALLLGQLFTPEAAPAPDQGPG